MKELNTIEDVNAMNYVQFISLLRETNRCPGGKTTIRRILQNSFIDSNSLVLDVGCNTGFTTLEIARTSKCKVIGIDLVPEALEIGKQQLKLDSAEVQNRIDFQLGSALNLPFKVETFDLVVTGGATSFIDEKQKAISEYYRVLKPWGYLSVTNLCYMIQPPDNLVNDVSKILGVKINPWGPDQWIDLFSKQQLFEIYSLEKYKLYSRDEKSIFEYVDYFMRKEHLLIYPETIRNAIRDRWLYIMSIFNQNHQYLGYILVLFRKALLSEEIELFSKFSRLEESIESN